MGLNYLKWKSGKKGENSAIAQDESLAEHDKKFHPEGFDPKKDECKLRETMAAEGKKDELGEFKGLNKENEDVRSYVTKAAKSGKKWVEVKTDAKGKSTKDDHSQWVAKGKHDKWFSLPDPKEAKETPNLDAFAGVAALEQTVMSEISDDAKYKRGERIAEGEGNDGPAYHWSVGGRELDAEDAKTLEAACKEAGYTSALNPDYTEVAVRPDLFNGSGQMTQFVNKDGEKHNDYNAEHKAAAAKEKYRHVSLLLNHYDDLKKKIAADCMAGSDAAALAYFMMRTKIRAGSSSDPQKGIGATDLCKGDISLSQDGETFYASFNGKSKQWWHVTCKDKFLYNYLKGKKEGLVGAGANSEPLFGVSYGKLCEYLGNASASIGCPEKFNPHDFRRCGATRVAKQYLDKELAGVDPQKDRKKWEDRIVKAVVAAAQHLNDKGSTVFSNYIVPAVLFESNKDEIAKYFPFMKGNEVAA